MTATESEGMYQLSAMNDPKREALATMQSHLATSARIRSILKLIAGPAVGKNAPAQPMFICFTGTGNGNYGRQPLKFLRTECSRSSSTSKNVALLFDARKQHAQLKHLFSGRKVKYITNEQAAVGTTRKVYRICLEKTRQKTTAHAGTELSNLANFTCVQNSITSERHTS